MRKRLKGYLSVEASLILPIVLFLYFMIILAALFLYCRCAISQDTFLLGMRAGRFTYGENTYGEVIYGEEGIREWAASDYVQERLDFRQKTYPVYPYARGSCVMNAESVIIRTWYKSGAEPKDKYIHKKNPVMAIREGRRC